MLSSDTHPDPAVAGERRGAASRTRRRSGFAFAGHPFGLPKGSHAAQTVKPDRVPDRLSAADWRAIQAQVAKLTAPDGGANDWLAGCVSVDG